jgi:glycosyltransferase involved in cell wall biosynthesis
MRQDPVDSGLWIFWPDYSHENPFQSMLYRAFPPGWTARSGDLQAAAAALAEGGRGVVFHLHWEDAIYREASHAAAAEALVESYLLRLDGFIAAGGRFVWTVHNEMPHEPRFAGLDGKLRTALAARARVVHMHSAVAASCMAPQLGISASRVLVTALGGFTGYYPDDISKVQARRYFGIDDNATVFVTLGALRAYKGLEALLDAFAAAHAEQPCIRLILAGRCGQQAAGRFVWLRPGVLMMPRYIDDSTIQYVMRAADFGVFAFRRVMVSSSVLLAETFGLPVIVPKLPTLQEMVESGRNGLIYPAGDTRALADAMLVAASLSTADRLALGRGAREDIRGRDWHHYASALIEAALQNEAGATSARVKVAAT